MVLDLILGAVAVVFGLAVFQAGDTTLAQTVGLFVAILGLLLVAGSLVVGRSTRR